jgi:hypothetical protein
MGAECAIEEAGYAGPADGVIERREDRGKLLLERVILIQIV